MGLYSLLITGNIINKDFTFYEVPVLRTLSIRAHLHSPVLIFSLP